MFMAFEPIKKMEMADIEKKKRCITLYTPHCTFENSDLKSPGFKTVQNFEKKANNFFVVSV